LPGAELGLEINKRPLDLDVHDLVRSDQEHVGCPCAAAVADRCFEAHRPRGARCRGDHACQVELA
jgi:hypothetical protein